MADKYGSSVVLLNGQAVCYLQMGKYEEAESVLQDALDKVASIVLFACSSSPWYLFSIRNKNVKLWLH